MKVEPRVANCFTARIFKRVWKETEGDQGMRILKRQVENLFIGNHLG